MLTERKAEVKLDNFLESDGFEAMWTFIKELQWQVIWVTYLDVKKLPEADFRLSKFMVIYQVVGTESNSFWKK